MTVHFRYGSRALDHGELAVARGLVLVYVSHIKSYGKRYISSIRLDWANGNSSVLGYHHADNESLISTKRANIFGFYVAHERGIRGIAVLSTEGVLSSGTRDHECIPKQRLIFYPAASSKGAIST